MSESDKDKFAEFDKRLEDIKHKNKEFKLAKEKKKQDKLVADKHFIKNTQDTVGVKVKQLVDWFNHKMDELNNGHNKLSIHEYDSVNSVFPVNGTIQYNYELVQQKLLWWKRVRIDIRVLSENPQYKQYRPYKFFTYLGNKLPSSFISFYRKEDTKNFAKRRLDFKETSFQEEFMQSLEDSFAKLVNMYEKGEL